MPEVLVPRRLAAIMATDVVGYSRLIGADEAGTVSALKVLRREICYPKIEAYGGRVVKTIGDGELIEFASVVKSLQCAVEVQRAMARRNADIPEEVRIVLRMGLNLGDVIIDGGDIHGDAVNVAARLEAEAEPGGICISRMVRDAVRDKLDYVLEDMDEVEVKNIDQPVHVFRVSLEEATFPGSAPPHASPHPLTDDPSIAVLHFENRSGNPGLDRFSDSISDGLTTALLRVGGFYVTGYNLTSAIERNPLDLRSVAQKLGVQYVVEGGVRTAGDRVRFTVRLVDGSTGNRLWAEIYDRNFENTFAAQDELTQTVVGAIMPELCRAEQERAKLKNPEDRGVRDTYLSGMLALHALTGESLTEAKRKFSRVIELDPQFSAAFSGLAIVHYYEVALGLTDDPDASRHAAFEAAWRGVELDGADGGAHGSLGRANMVNRKFEDAILEFDGALAINPSHALAHYGLGATCVFDGKPELGLPHLEKAIRFSPRDPHMGSFMVRTAQAYLHLYDYESAVKWARKALHRTNFQYSRHMILASALGHLGRIGEAELALQQLLQRIPSFSADYVLDYSPMVQNKDFWHMVEGLRKAGLPE